MRGLLAGVAVVVAASMGASLRAQEHVEAVSGDVWLGGSLFTVEDLENLDESCGLKPEQKEASLELMRGAMSRARTMSLKYYRGWSDQDWPEGNDPAAMARYAEEYQKKVKEQQEGVVKLEKEVMSDLRALLEAGQADGGWQRFERSRRRLIVRSAHSAVQQLSYRAGSGEEFTVHGFNYQEPVVDVVAMVRASKLSGTERAGLADVLEPYEAGLDALVTDWRPLAREHGQNQMMWWGDQGQKAPSQADVDKMEDIFKRMRQLQVRTARKVEDTLTGAAQERFQRQRLRRESRYRWMPAKRSPEIAAVLRLRSLTADQKGRIDALIKDADAQLLRFAIEDRHKQDEALLLDKEPDQNAMWGPGDPERAKQEQKLRRTLSRDVVALLTPEQRAAYDTGIENEQDLATAFDKRRGDADSPWEVDADLNPWVEDWQAQRDEE